MFPWGTGSEFTSLLVENVFFYFICEPGSYPFIVEFDMARGKLSTFDVPSPSLHRKQGRRAETGRLTVTEDGRLGFAYVHSSELFLWSREAGPSGGAMAWKLHRNIELNMIPSSPDDTGEAPSG